MPRIAILALNLTVAFAAPFEALCLQQIIPQDPVFCVCHGSQYDPLLLAVDVNSKSGAAYVGAKNVHGPTRRSLPVIPIRAVDDVLLGGMPDPRWYDPACG